MAGRDGADTQPEVPQAGERVLRYLAPAEMRMGSRRGVLMTDTMSLSALNLRLVRLFLPSSKLGN